jgi:RNA polymerase sigma-70 factor, ECF subfamily
MTLRDFLGGPYPRLVDALTLMCGSRPAAEDAVNEALARAWERSDRGEHIERLEAWVTTVATNLIRSRFRRLRVERKARSKLLAPAVATPSAAEAADVRAAVASLPARQRGVVVLHYYLDLSVAQTATLLGVSEGTVKTSLYRARAALAHRLAQPDNEEVPRARP